jgi:hypothetical protein
MPKDLLMLAHRKTKIALPVIVVLVLARCGSDSPDAETQTASESATQTSAEMEGADYSAEQIKAAVELLKKGESKSSKEYSAEEIKAAMREHIEQRTRLGKSGVFEITDPQTSQVLELQFQKIHDPVRVLPGNFYFACTNFATIGNPEKTYDLDFWLQPHDGELRVYQENVHKAPVRKDGEWVQKPHYNFVDDRINLLQ